MGFLLVVLMFFGAPFVAAYTDAFNLEGQLLCEGKPFANARLVFFEDDYFMPDICFTTMTNNNGTFRAYGYENDGPLYHADQLYFYIYHNCRSEKWGCTAMEVDDNAWARNSRSAPLYKLGAFELVAIYQEPCPFDFIEDYTVEYSGLPCGNIY
ncbi:hypothetical protein M3Y96_01254100 [Aphelenchoides besseyi]|nr:hypothetical protein M3Y96_01254100 [Aphelenchoides besseyi]